jgi:Lon protease-like protein
MLPPVIPIFPLPNAVLFPSVFLPLHVFEPRYREMVADALGDDRIIGMVLLRPGWEADYDGRPAVYPVGCAGLMTHVERLPDGRFNIILKGLQKFRILDEHDGRTYRLARVETVHDAPAPDLVTIREARQRLEALLMSEPRRSRDATAPAAMGDEDLVHTLSQYMQLEPIEKQALLECDDLLTRCRALIELLEMRLLVAREGWNTEGTH